MDGCVDNNNGSKDEVANCWIDGGNYEGMHR